MINGCSAEIAFAYIKYMQARLDYATNDLDKKVLTKLLDDAFDVMATELYNEMTEAV